jgi:hypothetical protein
MLSADELRRLLVFGEFEGLPIYTISTERGTRMLIEFVLSLDGVFELGVRRMPFLKMCWSVVSYLVLADCLQRVNVGVAACKNCDWSGHYADPTDPTLYYGGGGVSERVRRAWDLPQMGCPKCGARLPVFAIWAEPPSLNGKGIFEV